MKTTRNALLILLLLAFGTATAGTAQISFGAGIHVGPSGRAAVDLGFFYDNLASYGNWIQRPNYGWVWTPAAVGASWRPYEDGHWVWTDQGWTWLSNEPYGWATYHYGRWYQDPEIGWAWVPGDQWGPAWVSFQEGADYVGWAPIPPGVDISFDAGYGGGYGYGNGYYGGGYGGGYGIAPEAYVFVPERYFLASTINSYVLPPTQVVSIFGQTRGYTSFRRDGDRIINQGIPVDRIQRVTGRSVPRYQLADLGAEGYRQPHARIAGNQVQIFRPQVQQTAQVAPPVSRPAARRAVVSAEQFRSSHPDRMVQTQQDYANRQANRWQQQGAQPNRQVQPYQQRTYNQTNQYQTYRQQRQYQRNQQNQNQYNPPPQGNQQYQTYRQRQVNPNYAQRPQDQNQGNTQRQYRQPPPQSQGNHYGEYRGPQNQNNNRNNNNRNDNQKRQQRRDRNRDQNQDQNRPPAQ